jgi:hypothetical protein
MPKRRTCGARNEESGSDRARHGDELYDIEAALSAFVFGYEGLWPAEPFGQILLGQASLH